MELGVISYEVSRPTLPEFFDAVQGLGLSMVQFDFTGWTLDDEPNDEFHIPNNITEELARQVSEEAKKRKISIPVVNGFFNMVHRDLNVRSQSLYRFERLASVCGILGCNLINISTGSRCEKWMWSPHEDNRLQMAWDDMKKTMERVLQIAEKYDVYIGIETEASNVLNNIDRVREYMDQTQSPRLKIVMDGANLFQEGEAWADKANGVIDHAFELLGGDIMMVHGKDVLEGDGLAFTSAGKGIIDFRYFLQKIKDCGYRGGLVIHGAKDEQDLSYSIDYLKPIITDIGL